MAGRTVLVSNIPLGADRQQLEALFEFCGEISSIELASDESGDSQVARVVFFDTDASSTAVLLSGALIGQRAIQVSAADGAAPGPQDSAPRSSSPSHLAAEQPQTFTPVAPRRTASDAVANAVVAGYFKGVEMIGDLRRQAKEFDEKHQISQRAAEVAVPVAAWGEQLIKDLQRKAREMDEKHSLSQKAKDATKPAAEWAKQMDDEYRLRDKASLASFALQKAVSAGASAVSKRWAQFRGGSSSAPASSSSQEGPQDPPTKGGV
eukprot:RCo019235